MADKVQKDEAGKKEMLAKGVKCLLDFMFYCGMVVTVSLPFTIKWIGKYYAPVVENYQESVIIYFVLGVSAVVLIRELLHCRYVSGAQHCLHNRCHAGGDSGVYHRRIVFQGACHGL